MKINDHKWATIPRHKIIGGSDMAGILGYSKWSSPEMVMKQKITLDEFEVNDAMFWGTRLESVVADVYSEQYCPRHLSLFDPVLDWDSGAQAVHPEHQWLTGSPDRLIIDGDMGDIVGGLEIKCIGFFSKKAWKEGIPLYYQVQAQVYMMIFGLPEWEFFVLHGGQSSFHMILEENPFMQEEIIEKGGAFHQALMESWKRWIEEDAECDEDGNVKGGLREAMEKYSELLGEDSNEKERINSKPMGSSQKID